MVYSYAANDDPLFVSEGDYVQFKFKAPSTWDTTQTVTIRIGSLVQYWSLITIAEDYTPDPFPFTNVENAETSTMFVWADGTRPAETITTVSGLTDTTQASVSLTSNIGTTTEDFSIRFDYNGDGTWDTGWIHTTGGQSVGNGAKIQIRGKTSPFNNTPLRLTLAIGTSNETWTIRTKALPQNKPEPFPDFTDLVDQPANRYCYSEVIRVQGLLAAGPISMTNGGEYGISTTGNTFTNTDGFSVLTDTTFTGSQGTIQNGDYLQLRILSAGSGNTPKATDLNIADVVGGDTWTVTTGPNPSITPNSFVFPDIPDAIEDFLQPSDPRPVGGITGLGIPVQVELIDAQTTSSEVKIKINDGSIGVFPATVENGDIITLYARSSATFGDSVTATIKVGARQIATWTVQTNSGPDTSASFTPPPDRNNQVPNTYVSSAPITVTGINRPVTIEVLSGYDALISIDYDTPVTGPRVFDPRVNTSFYLVIFTSTQLNTPEFTQVSIGTGVSNNPFTWTVRTYAAVPPGAAQLGVWYSKKTEKFDGYQVGTVLPILKEGVDNYGTLDGELSSRYPGFIKCEGQSLSASQYGPLFDVLGNTYGGNGVRNVSDEGVITYTGNFNIPDYRNRKLCGIGIVDSNRGNSAFLPVSTSGKGINDVGAQGGYWYFDKVDSFGVQPLEQIQGPPTSTSGLNSQFFSLGTVRLEGLETITDSVRFSINGLVTAQIGPLNDVIVAAPNHNHAYISAVVESDGGDPLIPWRPVRALFGTAAYVPGEQPGSPGTPDQPGTDPTPGGAIQRFESRYSAKFTAPVTGEIDIDNSEGGTGGDSSASPPVPSTGGSWHEVDQGYRVGEPGGDWSTYGTNSITQTAPLVYPDGVTGTGTGAEARIRYDRYDLTGDTTNFYTIITVEEITNPGTGYLVNDILTTTFWNTTFQTRSGTGSAQRLIKLVTVSAGTPGTPTIPGLPAEPPRFDEDARSGNYRAEDTEMTVQAWTTWLNTITNFVQELQQYYGAGFTLDSWIRNNLPLGDQRNQESPLLGATDWGDPAQDYKVPAIEFLVWWTSPASALDGATLQSVGTDIDPQHTAVIDTEPASFRIDNYTPAAGNTLSHSHLLTEFAVVNPNTDFTGGNLSGAGSNADPLGSGLGAGVAGSIQTFRLWTKRDEFSLRDDNGAYVNRGIGEWAYRLTGGPDGGAGNVPYWTSVDDTVTVEEDLIYSNDDTGPQLGSGARVRMTATPWPSVNGVYPYGDTRYKIDLILSSGQNYQVGDKLTMAWWNNIEGSGDRMIEVTAVGAAGEGGAGEAIQVTFNQSQIFMDMTDGLFEFTSNFKKPTPVVTMRPQRQVPIINPFHKTKYIIKAY